MAVNYKRVLMLMSMHCVHAVSAVAVNGLRLW